MQTALTAVIALLSLSLVSCFLDKEIFEYCINEKKLKGVTWVYIAMVLLLLGLALFALPNTAQAESYSDAGRVAQTAYYGCAVVSVGTFLIQASIRYTILHDRKEQENRTKREQRAREARTARRTKLKS